MKTFKSFLNEFYTRMRPAKKGTNAYNDNTRSKDEKDMEDDNYYKNLEVDRIVPAHIDKYGNHRQATTFYKSPKKKPL